MTLYLPVDGLLTDGFNPVDRGYVPGLGYLGAHPAQDIAAPEGTPIYAAGTGTVLRSWWDTFVGGAGAGGWMTAVNYGGGVEIRYAHMEKPGPVVGTKVTATSIIGGVGQTGAANGPHVHVELYKNGVAVDPLTMLKPHPGPEATTRDGLRPPSRRKTHMVFIYKTVDGKTTYALFELGKPGTWWEFTGQDSANQMATQHGNAMAVSPSTWDERKRKHS